MSVETKTDGKAISDINLNVEEIFRSNLKKNQFISPSFEIYGSPTGFHSYGVLGTQLKRKIFDEWRKIFCSPNPDEDSFTVYEIDTPIIGPESVYVASGHVARFTDPVVKDANGRIERVDHYLKARIRGSDLSVEDQDKIVSRLDDFTLEELEELMTKFGEVDRKFGKISKQNLMLDTKTGLTDNVSYLRPETAQGLITEFKNIYKFNGEKLPFGISQIGRVYRKEISPRPFIRLREFEQAEIELFHDPLVEYALPSYMKPIKLNIFSAEDQMLGSTISNVRTLGEMVDCKDESDKLNSYIAYFMYNIKIFCDKIGLDSNRLRFRQHLKNELAHYSRDCWDMEYLVRDKATKFNEVHPDEKNWIEVIGIAHRGCYDLTQHNNVCNMNVKRVHEPPIEKIVYDIKSNMKLISKSFGKETNSIKQFLSKLNDAQSPNQELLDLIFSNNQESKNTIISINGKEFELESEMIKVEKNLKMITSEDFIPHIIEPSFGVDRLTYAVMNSLFWIRPEDSDRTVMSFNNVIAPITVAVLPLFTKDVMLQFVPTVVNQIKKSKPNFMIKVDCSGASIGKRYSRMDEIGVLYAITIDYQTNDDSTVTLRSRDSMNQVRVKIEDLFTD